MQSIRWFGCVMRQTVLAVPRKLLPPNDPNGLGF
jgi:hypothetical protein